MLHYTQARSAKHFVTSMKSRTSVNHNPFSSRRAIRVMTWALLLTPLVIGPVYAVVKSEASKQLEFGVKMALKGSWREAAFRFEKAVKADSKSAEAYNDLAVAHETLGEYEGAREAYEKALSLDPDHEKIRANYDLFMNFYNLHSRRSGGS